MNLIVRWVISSIIIMFIAWLLPGIYADSFWTIMCFSLGWGVISLTLNPLMKLIAIPITVITLGLFSLVINVFMVMIASSWIDGFECDGFWWALLFSAIYSIIASVFNINGSNNDED